MAKRKKSNKSIIAVILCAILAVVLLHQISDEVWDGLFKKAGVTASLESTAEMSVHFVDVGQGDCTIVYSKSGGVIVIDTGEEDKAQIVINYLKNLGVEKIDYCIMTHPHSDHMGSMSQVMQAFSVETLIMPQLSEINIPTTKTYEKFLISAADNADEIVAARAGDTYSMGEVDISILGPVTQDKDLNNMSVVAKIEYGQASFLITGDCSFGEENSIMENNYNSLQSDVLKIGHHGSSGATSSEWLAAVNPEAGVLSVGNNNSYGHPAEKLVERLDKFNLTYYRTDLLGTIVFETDGKSIALKNE